MPSGGKKITEDSLPAMPSWDGAKTRKIEQEGDHVEMGHLEKPTQGHRPMGSIGANSSSMNLLASNGAHKEEMGHPISQDGQSSQISPHYTGPDFGHGAGHPYTGPDFGTVPEKQTAYTAYAPSESTNYEPAGVNDRQELGTTYSNTLPPPSPNAHQQAFGHAPSVLQAGRRPGGSENGNGKTWRDV